MPRHHLVFAYAALLSVVYAQDALTTDDLAPPTTPNTLPSALPPNMQPTIASVLPRSPNMSLPSLNTSVADALRLPGAPPGVNASLDAPGLADLLLSNNNSALTNDTLTSLLNSNMSDIGNVGTLDAGLNLGNASAEELGNNITVSDHSNLGDVEVMVPDNNSTENETNSTSSNTGNETEDTSIDEPNQQADTDTPSPAPSLRPKTSSASTWTMKYSAFACVFILGASFM